MGVSFEQITKHTELEGVLLVSEMDFHELRIIEEISYCFQNSNDKRSMFREFVEE